MGLLSSLRKSRDKYEPLDARFRINGMFPESLAAMLGRGWID